MFKRRSVGDWFFDSLNVILLLLVAFACFYPFWYVFAVSLNDNSVSSYVHVTFWPMAVTFDNYLTVLSSPLLMNGFLVSSLRVVIGTTLSVLLSSAMAYALSRKELVGRTFWNIFILIPMYIGGGLIPTYLLVKTLHLLDSFAILVVGGLFSSWNIILLRTSFSAMPNELVESAKLDGANDLQTFVRIVLPCEKAIVATITLFVAVGLWNDWFAGDIYISSNNLKPVQTIMLNIINNAKAAELAKDMASATGQYVGTMVESIKMATIVLTVFPIVVVYPFLQKYFVKGIMVGSLKG